MGTALPEQMHRWRNSWGRVGDWHAPSPQTCQQEVGRWAKSRVENSHSSIRRRERAMFKSGQMKAPQKFTSVHADVHNYLSLEPHLVDCQTCTGRRTADLAVWQPPIA